MPKQTRKAFALVPTCQALDTRLAPSGNFLASGFHDAAEAVKHVEHRPAEHSTMGGDAHSGGMKVHYHHHAK